MFTCTRKSSVQTSQPITKFLTALVSPLQYTLPYGMGRFIAVLGGEYHNPLKRAITKMFQSAARADTGVHLYKKIF